MQGELKMEKIPKIILGSVAVVAIGAGLVYGVATIS